MDHLQAPPYDGHAHLMDLAKTRGPFDLVLADPPWLYWGSPDKNAAAGKHYGLMSDEALQALPVRAVLASRAVVLIWTTSSSLARAVHLIEAWGLHYRGVAFDWVKTRRDGRPMGARGVRPSITKPLTEQVLAASTMARGRPLPLSDEAICQTVFAPVGQHSAKPEDVQRRLERMYPDARKLEMFSRRARPGWSAWGDQAEESLPSMPLECPD